MFAGVACTVETAGALPLGSQHQYGLGSDYAPCKPVLEGGRFLKYVCYMYNRYSTYHLILFAAFVVGPLCLGPLDPAPQRLKNMCIDALMNDIFSAVKLLLFILPLSQCYSFHTRWSISLPASE